MNLSVSRTILDLILVDRLYHLEDKDSSRRLQLSAEVTMSVKASDTYGNPELLRGRADWALGYGQTKVDIGAILLIVEAKPFENFHIGLPQLVVYMASVYEARKGKTNRTVFGMVSDAKDFKFTFLNENKKLFISESYSWVKRQSTILSYIDMMLENAIHSSPHTTTVKVGNRNLYRFQEYLSKRWSFGPVDDSEVGDETEYEEVEREEGEIVEDEVDDQEDRHIVDIVDVNGKILCRASTKANP